MRRNSKFDIRYSIFALACICALILVGFAGISIAEEYSLKQCIDLALAKNPRVISAKENVGVASAKMGEAGSGMIPTISLSASKGLNYTQPYTIALPAQFGGGFMATAPDETSNYTAYSATLTQILFAGGKVLTGMSLAKAQYDSSVFDLKNTKQNVFFDVTSAYYNVLKAKKNLEVTEESIKDLKRNLRLTDVFFNSGISSVSDLLRIRAQAANMEVARLQAETGYEIAKLAFTTAVGQDLKEFSLKEEQLTGTPVKLISSEEALSKAYDNRPDFLAFKRGLDAASGAINMAYSGYLPNIVYMYSVGKTITDYNINSASNSDVNDWRSMFVASWNIFDGFNTTNKVREAYATLNAAKAQEQSIKDGIALEVNSAYSSLTGAIQKAAAADVAADLAEQAFKSVEVGYKENTISEQSYLDTQNMYHGALLVQWAAKYDLEVAKAKLNQVTGTEII